MAGAGAREAGVSEFVDFMVWSDPSLQYKFRFGLGWLDCAFGTVALESVYRIGTQSAERNPAASGVQERFREGQEDGRVFFDLMREYTLMGFYTSRVGLEELDCPDLQFYTESPACPHLDDREHLHLPPPKY